MGGSYQHRSVVWAVISEWPSKIFKKIMEKEEKGEGKEGEGADRKPNN